MCVGHKFGGRTRIAVVVACIKGLPVFPRTVGSSQYGRYVAAQYTGLVVLVHCAGLVFVPENASPTYRHYSGHRHYFANRGTVESFHQRSSRAERFYRHY